MKKGVISGDIVAFTSLSKIQKELVEDRLKVLLAELERKFDCFARVVKGDYLECVVPKPEDALTVALLIKSTIKSIPTAFDKKNDNRAQYFENYGVRLAIGYGTLERFDVKKGIIDGEAIYLSGRKINEEDTHTMDRISIKSTLFFVSNEDALNFAMEPIMALLDFLMNKATARQSEVLQYKLLGYNEDKIAKKMGISQSAVNQHSNSAGWNAIEKTVTYFHDSLKNR
ncbi:MAG: fumarate hydratase [Flavobacteriaceae bacterium]